MSADASSREALRQQLLLRALWGEDNAALGIHTWLRERPSAGHGLAAYRRNAGAVAERALAGPFPTISALLGDESFAALARDFWHKQPPRRGDLGQWGETLPEFILDQQGLADEPYLADSARLDWAWHGASRAADPPATPPALERLADTEPAWLRLILAPGTALVESAWPVASIWQAHQREDELRFDEVRVALAEQRREHAFVVRDGYGVQVHALSDADAAFTRALLEQRPLAAALDDAPISFAFDRWLAQALTHRWLVAVDVLPNGAS